MLLAWQSRKLKCVVKSTLIVETLPLQEATEIAVMMKTMFLEILNVDAHNHIFLIKCVTDSKIHYAIWVCSEGQIADCLPKEGAS